MSDNFDFSSNSRIVRSTSEQSVENTDAVESQNLLDGTQHADQHEDGQVSISTLVGRAVKRALEPVLADNKQIKKQNFVIEKKLTTVLQKSENQERLIKEMMAAQNKGADDLDTLLTSDGIAQLKVMCFRNLDLKAKDDTEVGMLNNFMQTAKDEGWRIKTNDRSKKDIIMHFRDKRNYLKSQVRLRVFDDLTNKTAEQAVELPRTVKFLRDHLGVTEINDDCLLVLYNFVFTHLKYMNKKVDMETFNQNEKKNAKYAREQPWAYVMERVESDRQSKKDYTVVKERISAFMRAGHVFETL